MNGLIIVNKPKEWTSRDVVNKVGKIFNTTKVGHTGTLDPLAEGVLVVAIGDALKVVDIITSIEKEYIAEATIGFETDTLDITGNKTKESTYIPTQEEIINVLNSFKGEYLQEVPLYSSVKVNGKRLYEYAREQKEVELPKRKVSIKEIEFLESNKNTFKFRVKVSKGTYIRSLIRDIGERLNTCCNMSNLLRTKQGIFNLEDSYTIEDIENNNYTLIPIYEVLKNEYIVEVDSYIENKISNGAILENRYDKERIIFVNKDKKVLGIYNTYEKNNTKIKPYKIFK